MDAAIAVTRSAELAEHDSDIFIDAHQLWRQPGAPGGFGGAILARCLMAAAATGKPGFIPYSLQSIFVTGASPDSPLKYFVDRTRDGRGFLSRRVRAEQQGRCVVEALISFTREPMDHQPTTTQLQHHPELAVPLPPPDHITGLERAQQGQNRLDQPFDFLDCPSVPSSSPSSRRMHRWARAKGFSSDHDTAHYAALLLMSDHRFAGISARAHRVPRFSAPGYHSRTAQISDPAHDKKELDNYLTTIGKVELAELQLQHTAEEQTDLDLKATRGLVNEASVTLSHTMYFHARPKADDWIFMEMGSSWTGNGRGLVEMRMWDSERKVLLATCVQEGMVKLKRTARL